MVAYLGNRDVIHLMWECLPAQINVHKNSSCYQQHLNSTLTFVTVFAYF